MSKSNAAAKLPDSNAVEKEYLLSIVTEHRKRKHEPLHLAIHFQHPKHKKDICLFEVIGGFGNGEIDRDRSIFEMVFSNPASLKPASKNLRLFLTSPEELRQAIDQDWNSLRPVRVAVREGKVDIIAKDRIGTNLLELLK